MRKLKSKKENNIKKLDYVQEKERALKEAERIFEKPEEYKIFKFLVQHGCQNMPDEIAASLAIILVDITMALKIKDKNKRAKAENNIRMRVLKYINKLAPFLLPNSATQSFLILLELNEILVEYTECENKFIKELEKVKMQKDYSIAKELLKEKNSFLEKPIKEILGYEPVFLGELKEKCQDVVNWIAKTLIRMMKYNSEIIIHDTLFNYLDQQLEKISVDIEEKFSFTEQSKKLFNDENTLLKEQTMRLKFLKNNLKEMEEENKLAYPQEYKKDMAHLKNTLTRIKTLFTIFYNLSNYGEVTGESNLNFVEVK